MNVAKLKQFFFQSKVGQLIGGAYIIYVVVLMVSSAQLGLQLGEELKVIPADLRTDYIFTFFSDKL